MVFTRHDLAPVFHRTVDMYSLSTCFVWMRDNRIDSFHLGFVHLIVDELLLLLSGCFSSPVSVYYSAFGGLLRCLVPFVVECGRVVALLQY